MSKYTSREAERSLRRSWANDERATAVMLWSLLGDDISYAAIMEFIDECDPEPRRLEEFIEGLASDFWYQCMQAAMEEEDLDIIDWKKIRREFSLIHMKPDGERA